MGRERGVPPRNKAAIHIEPAVINVSCYRRASEYFHLRASAPRLASRRRIYTPVNTTPFFFPFPFFFFFFFPLLCARVAARFAVLSAIVTTASIDEIISSSARKERRGKTGEEGEGGVERGPQLYLGSAIIDCFGGFELIRFDRRVPIFFLPFCDRIDRFRRRRDLGIRFGLQIHTRCILEND